MINLGIDIGTTTICAVAFDLDSGKLLESVTKDNGSFIEENGFDKLQDPKIISKKVFELAEYLTEKYENIGSIGFTGQMHGILYLDASGEPLSPLFTWQDGRGNEALGTSTYAEELSKLTGYKLASGFGNVTHFYNSKNGLVPENTAKYTTIHSFLAMKLGGATAPILHTSDAASLGLFDLKRNCFDESAINKAGIDPSLLPEVTDDPTIVGAYKGIPVCVALGDNQASFIGSIKNEDSLLINIGTGAQISMITEKDEISGECEIRPLYSGKKIAVGSSLCGGRAYAVLKDFLSLVLKELGGIEAENLYKKMDELALSDSPSLEVSTKFSGTRSNPQDRGYIKGVGVDNFTPAALIKGTVDGIVRELFELYDSIKNEDKKPSVIIGSGNGIRRSEPTKKALTKLFELPLMMPAHSEEAAFGAMLFSLAAAGIFESVVAAQNAGVRLIDA